MGKWDQAKNKFNEGESILSPTIFLKGSFTTLIINAFEGIEVATFHVPIYYLHSDIPNDRKGFIGIKSNICRYNVSNQFGAQ